jgi:uncharacterized protein DUF2490
MSNTLVSNTTPIKGSHHWIKNISPVLPTRYLALWVLFFVGSMLLAQETKVVSDLHLWSGVAVEKGFGKDWSVFLAEEIRFKKDISVLNKHYTEAGVRYRIDKNFALEGQYRVTFDQNKDKSFDMLSRYALDLRYKGKLDFITIYYRLRYQKEVEGWNLLDPSVLYKKHVRNRITVRYTDFNRFKPYVSAEIFQLFEPFQNADLEYMRVLGGIKYEHRDLGTINLAWGFNRELTKIQPAMIYTLKVNYTYSF